jgi:hypothetical protein
MAPEKKMTDKMKMIPATITTHAAAAYSRGGLARGAAGGGGAAATVLGWVEGSGVSLMH